jgi:hypothetical protein
LTAFFAIFALVRFFAFAFIGAARRFPACNFFLAALDLAAARVAFLAFGRFFDLLFFAMVLPLLTVVSTCVESSPENVRCHL